MSPVTPVEGTNFIVGVGGAYVIAIPASPKGGYIVNPFSSTDQGIAVAEVLYIDPVAPPGTTGDAYGTTVALQPGQIYTAIPGQTTPTYVNAVTSGHRFTAVYW